MTQMGIYTKPVANKTFRRVTQSALVMLNVLEEMHGLKLLSNYIVVAQTCDIPT